MLVASCGVANTQADTKSVTTPEAIQSNILPSTRDGDRFPQPGLMKTVVVKKTTERKVQKVTRTTERKQVAKPVKKTVVVSGIRASAWTGKGYNPRWESVRKCIVKRESGGNYMARNPSSSAQGAYQFLNNLWNRPLAEKLNKPELLGLPIASWSRVDQDRAFWLVWANGAGKSHWNYPPKPCW
jgi:hypothetical protein